MKVIKMDKVRYGKSKMPCFQYFYRKAQESKLLKLLFKCLFVICRNRRNIDMSVDCQIGGGLFFAHASGITINSHSIIGNNCNISKGVTIGRENRGRREGTPVIGNNVWIGVNATIVGRIHIGDDVLIAPNAFVNFDVPSHSIVIGNPGVIKYCGNATEAYINNTTIGSL